MDHNHDSAPRTPSNTLPAHFHFTYTDAALPKTPEPIEARSSTPPQPDPPRIRVKRRRPGFDPHEDHKLKTDMTEQIPSIELSESLPPVSGVPAPHSQPQDDARLSPIFPSATFPRAASPPHTPVAKIHPAFYEKMDWYSRQKSHEGGDIPRPSSAFSQLSDSSSSFSSFSSSDTLTSVTDSCFTPDIERKDCLGAIANSNATANPSALASPVRLRPSSSKKLGRRTQKHPVVRWTQEMDEHLWLTYINYLSDPTVTPFKTLPGIPPPTGVCHRVAHVARKTWKSRRNRLGTVMEDGVASFASLDGTIMRREGSAPPILDPRPIDAQTSATQAHWPKESATRKRLRALCKRKPSLSPHYQRLMQSRSPSPFESSSRGRVCSTPTQSSSASAFGTRDMNIDLTTSTASSMQPGGPLAQLASEQSSASTVNQCSSQRTIAHQKSQSLEHDLDFAMPVDQPMQDVRRLASPFHESRRNTTSSPQAPPLFNSQLSGPSSPPELHHPRPLSNSMKRRAQYSLGEEYLAADPSVRVEYLQNLFKDPEAGAGKRRVRSRGFSLGAMRHGQPPARHISNLFTPPATSEVAPPSSILQAAVGGNDSSKPTLQPALTGDFQNMPSMGLTNSSGEGQSAGSSGVPRLGSPFSPSFGLSNTFPRNLFPLGLDSMAGVESHSRHASGTAQPGDGTLEDPFVVPGARGPSM